MQQAIEQFERLIRETSGSIARLAATFEPDPAACEDLIQEIALALWKALPGFRGECSERTLVFRIAHNRALTHLPRRYRNAPVVEPDAVHLPDHQPSPEAAASSEKLRTRLLTAIRALPIGQRQVITLLLEGLSHANIAVRTARARKALRERLEDFR